MIEPRRMKNYWKQAKLLLRVICGRRKTWNFWFRLLELLGWLFFVFILIRGEKLTWILFIFIFFGEVMGKLEMIWTNGFLLPKLFWSTVRKHCSSDRDILLKFKAEGQEFADHYNNLFKLVTDRSSVLPFCPNRTEQVN